MTFEGAVNATILGSREVDRVELITSGDSDDALAARVALMEVIESNF